MVKLAIQGLIEDNVDYARRVLDIDNRLDYLYVNHLKKLTLMETMSKYYVAKIVVTRHVEHIGDLQHVLLDVFWIQKYVIITENKQDRPNKGNGYYCICFLYFFTSSLA